MKLFAETTEKLLNESGSLNKIEIISDAIKKIETNDELYLFCLYLTGVIFPSSVQKTINVGKALIRDAAINLLGITKEEWEKVFREFGETGEAVEKLINNYKLGITNSENIVIPVSGTQRSEVEEDRNLVGLNKNEIPVEFIAANAGTGMTSSDPGLFESSNSSTQQPVNTTTYSPIDNFSLEDLNKYISRLTETSGSLAKVQIIAELLSKLNPIEAKYACKLLLQNLRIGVQEPTVETAIAKAFEVEKKKVSELNFYLGDIGEIAIRCKEKNFENIKFRLFHPIKAMLASAEVEVDEIFKRMTKESKNVIPVSGTQRSEVEEDRNLVSPEIDEIPAFAGMTISNSQPDKFSKESRPATRSFSEVWAEYKYDGIRAHIHKKGDRVEIFTRDQKRITDQFPEVVKFFANMKADDFLLDGEIVPYSGGKIHPFAYIQKRLGKKEGLDEEVEKNPAAFIGYDFLFFGEKLLFDLPLFERRKMLEEIFIPEGMMLSTKKLVSNNDEFLDFFKESKSEGREGLMIKNSDSKYEPGKRGIHWLKYKQTLDPLDVVILVAEFGEGKNAKYLSSFTFGVWDEKKENLIKIGRVASGANEEDLKHFTEFLPTIMDERLPNGFKVKPIEILEVGFENIQISERFESGYAVRFPRLLRIRTGDKPLDEISTIQDVKRIYEEIKGKTTK